ncbi:MAG: hypothetical protein GX491_21835 [Chloroflexi bacterium]|nr:hypothetical protein [Chloroflexota bacterium]
MTETTIVLVNGEVLAGMPSPSIDMQKENAIRLAEGLASLLTGPGNLFIMHGNKPQIGSVLYRAEIASSILYPIPLDVCGADTQGATGYMLTQAIKNTISRFNGKRAVVSIMTQTLVDANPESGHSLQKAIGPWFDRGKAELYQQTRGWNIVEDPGRGYRRSVPSFRAVEIVEKDVIRELVNRGVVVIAAGGGGIPVVPDNRGELIGIEAVIDTEEVACKMAAELQAQMLLMVVENDHKFILSGLSLESKTVLSLADLEAVITGNHFESTTVSSKLRAADDFLKAGGKRVAITTLRKLKDTLSGSNGLWIEADGSR